MGVLVTPGASSVLPGRLNRTYANCWNEDKIRSSLEERIEELESGDVKSKSRTKLLRAKISKLKKALDGKARVGGQILPRNPKISKIKKPTKLVCFKCRKRGHVYEECTKNSGKLICYLCGSNEHTLKNCKEENKGELPYATCFVCSATGHLAATCPENPKGIYPNGSGCHFCGSVQHMKINCPERKKKTSKIF